MNFKEWEAGVSGRIKAEPEWNFYAYPRALFMYSIVLLSKNHCNREDFWNADSRRFSQNEEKNQRSSAFVCVRAFWVADGGRAMTLCGRIARS